MREVSKELGNFQVTLSEGQFAHIPPKVATEVFSSIAYMESISASALARKCGTDARSVKKYCDRTEIRTPNFNKFVHLMERLGYDVFLKKKPD